MYELFIITVSVCVIFFSIGGLVAFVTRFIGVMIDFVIHMFIVEPIMDHTHKKHEALSYNENLEYIPEGKHITLSHPDNIDELDIR